MAGPARTVSIAFLGNTADLEAALARAGIMAEDTSKKIQGSARMAAAAAAQQAKEMGASSDEIAAAAGKAAITFTEANAKISASARATGSVMLEEARRTGASVDEQRAAWAKGVASVQAYEAAQKRAADAAKASADEQIAAAKRAAAETTAHHKAAVGLLSNVGKYTLGAGVAGGYFAVKGAADYQAQMERLHTQAGATQRQVRQLSPAVLNMGTGVATGPNQLAQAMYHVTSSLNKSLPAVSRNATELKVLKVAAEGAKVGNANLVDVTNALDAAVVSGMPGVKNYKQAMGELNATVGTGDMTMQDLANALSTGILGPMQTYGLTVKDVGGALAVFGDNNIRGQEAATKLTSAVRIMAAPSNEAAKALHVVGISATQLGDDMRKGGLVLAISDLRKHLKESGLTATEQGLIITRAFGGRQSTGVQLLIHQLGRLKAATHQVGAEGHSFGQDWQATTHTFKFELDQAGASAEVLGVKVGQALIPEVKAMVTGLESGVNWLEKHKLAAEAAGVAVSVGLGAAISVYAYQKATAFVSATKGMISGAQQLGSKLLGIPFTETQSETQQLTGAIQNLTARLEAVTPESQAAAEQVAALGGNAGTAAGEVASLGDSAATADGQLSAFGGELETIQSQLVAVGDQAAATGAQFTAMGAEAQAAGAEAKAASLLGTLGKFGAFAGVGALAYLAFDTGKGSLGDQVPSPYRHVTGGGKFARGGPLVNNATTVNGLSALQQDLSGVTRSTQRSTKQWQEYLAITNKILRQPDVTATQRSGLDALRQKIEAAVQISSGGAAKTGMTLSKPWLHAATGIGGLSSGEQVNAAAIMAALTRGGLSTAGAAAITGNWVQESSLNPNEPGGLLAQWGGSRLTNEQSFAKQKGVAYNSIPAEAAFTLHELQSTPGLLSMLQSGKYSPQQLALAVENKYEEPKGTQPGAGYFTPDTYWSANTAGRESYAAQIYSAFAGKQTAGNLVGISPVVHPSASTQAAYNALVGGSGSSATGGKVSMRYYKHRPVGMMNEAQWQAWQAQHTGTGAATERYFHHQPVGDMTTAQWQAWEAKHTAANVAVERYYQHRPVGKMTMPQWQAWEAKASFGRTALPAIQRYQSITQTGTPRTLENALGVRTGGTAYPEFQPQHGTGSTFSPNYAQLIHDTIEHMGRNPSSGLIGRRLGGTLNRAASGSAAGQKYEQEIADLLATGQTKLADRLVAAHKQAMNTLATEMYAQQRTKDGELIDLQATELKDQTTAIQNSMQDAQTVWQASETKIADMASAVVQSMQDVQQIANDTAAAQLQSSKDVQQITNDQKAGVVQRIQDMTAIAQQEWAMMAAAVTAAATIKQDQSQAIVDAINDSTQIQVDQIGERGLYGLTLIAQQDKVHADQVKQYWDQQIDNAQQALDVAQVQASQQENLAQLNVAQVTAAQQGLVSMAQIHVDQVTQSEDAKVAAAQIHLDQVTQQQHALTAAAQQKVDAVTLREDQKAAAAQAHADRVQLHGDVTLVGPAQIAVDMNANASKATQDQMAANLKYATGVADQQEASAQLQLAATQTSAQQQTDAAQAAANQAAQTSAQAIQQATGAYQSTQNQANQAIQDAQGQLADAQSTSNTAIASANQQLADVTGQWNVTLAQLQANLTGTQGQAAQAEAAASGTQAVAGAVASTEFAGSGINVNIFASDTNLQAGTIEDATSWAFRGLGIGV